MPSKTPEENRARVLAWQKANPEKVNAKARAWAEANPEKRAAAKAAWAKSEAGRAYMREYHKARARKKAGIAAVVRETHICPDCGAPYETDVYVKVTGERHLKTLACSRECGARAATRKHDRVTGHGGRTSASPLATGERRVGPCENSACTYIGVLRYDHDHTTGLFRGWLCDACNRMLGVAVDNPALLRGAADYIERHSAPPGDGVKGLSPGPTSPGP